MAGNIRRFWRSSLGDYFSRDLRLVKDSETPRKWAETSQFAPETTGRMTSWQPSLNPAPASALTVFTEPKMPYALFSNDAKLSKAYPTAADVWTIAQKSGLVVDFVSEDDKEAPHPVLDHDYEIRPCQLEPHEDPARNKAEAEREAQTDLQLAS